MKKGMWILAMALLLVTGCKKNSPVKDQQKDQTSETDQEKILTEDQTAKLQEITDPEGWVSVRLEEGQVWLAFHPEKWPEASGIDQSKPEPIYGRVLGLGGRAISASVSRVFGLMDSMGEDGYARFPILVLLMEDGSLEWLPADPSFHQSMVDLGDEALIYSWGKIYWMEDIVSLSVEKIKEGVGREMTIFAENDQGVRYDLQYALNFQNLVNTIWKGLLDSAEDQKAYLVFDDQGHMSYERRRKNETQVVYRGNYKLHLAEDGSDGMRAGCISFDLLLDEADPTTPPPPKTIKSGYSAEIDQEGQLWLWPLEGDSLYEEEGYKQEVYQFFMTEYPYAFYDIEYMNDEDLINYLIGAVPEAEVLFYEQELSALVTGEITDLGDGLPCRDVWLGIQKGDHFAPEVFYTINPMGDVYKYDPEGDAWNEVDY